jgi:hypothetical protein
MEPFQRFLQTRGPAVDCRTPQPGCFERYQDRLPLPLIEEWKRSGWCSFANGFFWTVDPSDFTETLEDWSIPSAGSSVFARTAFGNLFYWNAGWAYSLDVHTRQVDRLVDRIEIVFDYLFCSTDYCDVLNYPLYRAAVARLGQPLYDECFAFVPALALGGGGEIETIQKVKVKEHLSLLAQF